MNRSDAARLARGLMNDHGLGHVPFEFDRSVRRFGAAHWSGTRASAYPAKLTISERLTGLNGESVVRDVVLHEIAHFLAGHGANHGPRWKAEARRIGADPSRCYESEDQGGVVKQPPSKYTARCPGCGKEHKRNRVPSRGKLVSCGTCSPKFDERFVLRFRRRTLASA